MLTTKKWVAAGLGVALATVGVVLLGGCMPRGPRALLDGARLIRQGRYPQAVGRLQVATRLLPQNAQAWNYLGLAYHGSHQFEPAAQAYVEALRRDRNLAAARFNLGCLYAEQGDLAAAIPELTTYTLLQPQAIEGWLQLGLAQLRARQFTAAENSFLHARQIDPRHPEALNDLGLIQLQRRRWNDAYRYFAAALQQDSHYSPAWWNAAVTAESHLRNRSAALECYQRYLTVAPRGPNRAEAEQMIALLNAELHPSPRPEPAIAVAQAAPPPAATAPRPTHTPPPVVTSPAPPPTNPPAALAQATTESTRPPPTAPPVKHEPAPESAAASTPAPTPVPTPVPVPVPRSTIPVEVVRLPEEPPLRPAIEGGSVTAPPPTPGSKIASAAAPAPDTFNPPSRVVPAPERAGFFQRLNPTRWFRRKPKTETPPALASGSTPVVAAVPTAADSSPPPAAAPEATPSRPEPKRYAYLSPAKPEAGQRSAALTYLERGATAYRDGRLAAAITAYRKAVQLDPAFFEAQYNLGLAAYEAGELPLSLSAYETALAIKPESLDGRYNFALALQRAGYPRDAANELEKVLAAHPAEARAHLTLANLYAQALGQPRLARAHYLKVLALDPGHPQSGAIRNWLAANPP